MRTFAFTEKLIDIDDDAGSLTPEPGVMTVITENGVPVMVNFLCPCGCGMECPTHVVEPGKPRPPRRWVYSPGPTLSPSIRWVGNTCHAHFKITDGKVDFSEDSGR